MRGRGHHRHGPLGMRSSVRELLLAALIAGPAHGYELMKRLETASGGDWRPSPGSVYPNLQLLEDEGLVVQEDGPEGRRRFALTEEGLERANRGELRSLRPSDEGAAARSDLRSAVRRLVVAAQQVGSAATTEQIAKAAALVSETRKALYELLQED